MAKASNVETTNTAWNSTAPLSEFRPYIPESANCAGVHVQGRPLRRDLRHHLRRGHGLRRPSRRPDRLGLHPDRRALEHQPAARLRQGHASSRTTSCRRRARRANRSPPARSSRCRRSSSWASRFEYSRIFHAGADRRVARRAVHDPPAPPADRAGARQPAVSGRHRLRRRAGGRRKGRLVRQPRLLGPGPRWRLHLPDGHGTGLEAAAAVRAGAGCQARPSAPRSPASISASATSSARGSRA